MTANGTPQPGNLRGKHALPASLPARLAPPRRSRGALAAAATAAALAVATAGCTGPTFTTDTYLTQALQTSVDMLSAVSTGVMVAELAGEDKAFTPYLDVSVTDAEESARSIINTFGTRQPPTPASEELREKLTGLNRDAVDGLSDLRTAIRWEAPDRVDEAESSLRETASGLVEVRECLQ